MLLAVMRWLTRAAEPGQPDIYVFVAGHGLASDNGEHMYLLPYDGAPDLLERTAIRRDELFADIASIKPRSVTVFLDTCYSGACRGNDMLIPKPAHRHPRQAKPLEEAKHGIFSYFLMKGMEGAANANRATRFQPVNFIRTSSRTSFSSRREARHLNCREMLTRLLVRFQ